MSQHDVHVCLEQMRDHAVEAIDLASSRSRADLDGERLLNLALVRLVEIVGEAARRIPLEEREHHTRIPWPEITGMRDRLIHGYDQVDFDILWQVVTIDLPDLVRELDRILASR